MCGAMIEGEVQWLSGAVMHDDLWCTMMLLWALPLLAVRVGRRERWCVVGPWWLRYDALVDRRCGAPPGSKA